MTKKDELIKVHIADPHKMLVDGIHSLIDKSEIASLSGVSETLEDCWKVLEKEPPDVLLIELSQLIKQRPDFFRNRKSKKKKGFYNGIDFCEEVKRDYPEVKIVVLTGYTNWTIIRRLVDEGVSGYVLKTSSLNEVLNAIDNVVDGKNIYLCPKSKRQLHKEITEPFFWVTIREQQLLRLLSEGFTNQEIADELFLGHETIKSYRKFLIHKFGVEDSTGSKGSIGMLKKAMQMGLIWEDIVP